MSSGQYGHADDLARSDIEALGATRSELGADYEDALLDSFADRVERAIDQRVAGELARRDQYGHPGMHYGAQPGFPVAPKPPSSGSGAQLALGIVSIVALIPLCITLGVTGNFLALLVAVAAILGVNVAHAMHFRRPDPPDPRRR